MAKTRQYNTKSLYFSRRMAQAMGGILDRPLTVVEAPMGYGKTTAVKEFLKDCGAKVLWQTLADDSVSGFWRGFCRLLRKIDAGCADRMAELGVPSNSIYMDTAMELMEGVVFAERTVMVFDDYHLLASKSVEQFIELLVKTEPPNLHIIIISRAMFGENTMELALKGFCYVIDKRSFEFTPEEIIDYYRRCGVRLRPEEAAELHAYTEGWISALYLSLLSFVREGRVERQASLPELIEKAVFRQYPAEVKGFLLTICVFDSFTLAQAKAIWPQGDAEAMVSYLMANNSFIKYDKYNDSYQMHNILTDYLRELLERQGEGRRRAAMRAAGNWYAGNGDYSHAMEAFYQAGDFDSLLAVLELDRGHSINNEHREKVIGYFRECPTAIKTAHPWACLIYAVYLFVFNETELFAQQCAEIGGCIEQIAAADEDTKRQLAGELELLRSFARYNDIAGMTAHHQRAANLLKGPSKFIDKRALWTFGSPSVLYMYHRESGRLEQEVADITAAMPHYYRITGGHGAGAEIVMQAERYYHCGDLENAEIAANRAVYVAQSQGQMAIVMCVLFLQVRLAVFKGDLSGALAVLQQTREYIKREKLYHIIHTLELCEGFVYAGLGQAGKVPAWIAKGDVKDSSIYFPAYAFFNMVYGKALLISGQYLKLLGLAGQFGAIAGVFPNLLGQVYTHIYAAAALQRLSRHREARAALGQAAAIAAPDGLIMPFVENGEYIGAILDTLASDDKYAAFAARVQESYAAFAPRLAAMRAAEAAGDGTASLTNREREVAALVAAGLSNQAIAKQLVIEEATVKKTLQNIYAKLGINSRTVLARLIIERKMG